MCDDVSRIIPDTDGKGHGPGGEPGPARRRRHFATTFVVLLVRNLAPSKQSCLAALMSSGVMLYC